MKRKDIIEAAFISISNDKCGDGYDIITILQKDGNPLAEFIFDSCIDIFSTFSDGLSDDLIDSSRAITDLYGENGYIKLSDNIDTAKEDSFFASFVINSKFEIFFIVSRVSSFFKYRVYFVFDDDLMHIAIPELDEFINHLCGENK